MRKYYDIEPMGGGGDPTTPQAPKNYKATTAAQRQQWNGFLDYIGKTPNANLADSNALFSQYKKTNPEFSLSPNDLANIQYEQYQLRKGDKFGNLDQNQLKYIRQGLPETYLNKPIGEINGQLTPETAKLYYPQVKDYGTDLEGYYNAKTGTVPAQPAPPVINATDVYKNHDTALKRATLLASQKGKEFLHGRADALINANYIPSTDTESFKDSATKAATPLGLDPALFWASTAEEGATGLIPDKNGNINTGDESHVDLNGKYPVDGFTNLGLDHFHDNFKELVKRGYLPKDFDYQKATIKNPENGEVVNSGNFKSVADAMKAKAAYVKMEGDNLQDWAKSNGDIKLSPTAQQFFTLVSYNGGPGTAHKLINYYKSKGLLEGDKFLSAAPDKKVDPGDSYGKVLPRWQMANLLKEEKVF